MVSTTVPDVPPALLTAGAAIGVGLAAGVAGVAVLAGLSWLQAVRTRAATEMVSKDSIFFTTNNLQKIADKRLCLT
jgi:hypothetical protein